jgi:hypothetical protein
MKCFKGFTGNIHNDTFFVCQYCFKVSSQGSLFQKHVAFCRPSQLHELFLVSEGNSVLTLMFARKWERDNLGRTLNIN